MVEKVKKFIKIAKEELDISLTQDFINKTVQPVPDGMREDLEEQESIPFIEAEEKMKKFCEKTEKIPMKLSEEKRRDLREKLVSRAINVLKFRVD